jgi:hypothetical protein
VDAFWPLRSSKIQFLPYYSFLKASFPKKPCSRVVVCPGTLPTPLFQGEVPPTSMVTFSNGASTYWYFRPLAMQMSPCQHQLQMSPLAHSQLYHRLTRPRVCWRLDALPVILHGAQVTFHFAPRANQIRPLSDSHLHLSVLPLAARGFHWSP